MLDFLGSGRISSCTLSPGNSQLSNQVAMLSLLSVAFGAIRYAVEAAQIISVMVDRSGNGMMGTRWTSSLWIRLVCQPPRCRQEGWVKRLLICLFRSRSLTWLQWSWIPQTMTRWYTMKTPTCSGLRILLPHLLAATWRMDPAIGKNSSLSLALR